MKIKKYTAKTLFGLENILADEIAGFGGKIITTSKRAVHFESDLKGLYQINLASRFALRVLLPIIYFRANNTEQLYRLAKKNNWTEILKINHTFLIDSVVNSKYFRHSKYAALKLKDAIVDQIREETGKRPNINVKDPDFRIHLHIDNDNCTISLDSSGESLHKRGYRISGENAPLNEVLAAGLIQLSGWEAKSDFIDPMCGSGTIPIEAAMAALNIPPNIRRMNFGFMNWKSFDKDLFKSVKKMLLEKRKDLNLRIICNDVNISALNSAKSNAKRARVDIAIEFSNEDFFKLNHNLKPGILICNPPYDERLKTENVEKFYQNLGDTLKKNYQGFDSWILSSNKDAMKRIGLRTSKRITLFNGALECKYHNFQMYQGSRKKKYEK